MDLNDPCTVGDFERNNTTVREVSWIARPPATVNTASERQVRT